jgi:hypothetical protein
VPGQAAPPISSTTTFRSDYYGVEAGVCGSGFEGIFQLKSSVRRGEPLLAGLPVRAAFVRTKGEARNLPVPKLRRSSKFNNEFAFRQCVVRGHARQPAEISRP